jgi:drug/metabolite transporter (DMT)-like permease
VDRLSDLRLPLLAGLGFGSYFIIMHYATEGISATVWPMIASRSAATLMLLALVLIRRESFSVQRDAWVVVLVNALLDVGGNFFYLLALQYGRLDISAILSSLYPGATVVLAWIILKERITRTQWTGILTALAAIVLFTM